MRWIILFLILVAGSGPFVHVAAADQAADEAAIRTAVKDYVAAYNAGDAKAIAAMWTEEAVYTNPVTGERAVGRDAIEQQFSAIFADNQDAKLVASTNSVQFVSPGVAVEHGAASVMRPEESPEETLYTAVYVKHDGRWLLDRVSEENEEPAIPSNYDQLQELAWMIGNWVDRDDQGTVETTCQWTKNRNFITRMFAVTVRDRIEVSGMQIIGWDPVAMEIRSWVFDSGGGFGEGTWTKKGNAWNIHAVGVTPDGSTSSATNIITRLDDNTFTWQSVSRIAGGELLPNVDEVVVIRQDANE